MYAIIGTMLSFRIQPHSGHVRNLLLSFLEYGGPLREFRWESVGFHRNSTPLLRATGFSLCAVCLS
jgi:hypothetical protein